MKVAFSVLNMPNGGWHWVMRVWLDGLEQPCTVVAAQRSHASAAAAFDEATREYIKRLPPPPSTPTLKAVQP